jgi:hypothetical protein
VARREAGSGGSGYSGALADMEPYRALIQGIERCEPYEDGSQAIKVILQLTDNPDDTLWAFITAVRANGKLILGKNKKTGKYSALRQFITAALGVPVETEVAAFDDETGHVWLKDEREAESVGRYVVIRGENTVKENGDRKFSVTHWQPDALAQRQPSAATLAAAQLPGRPAPQPPVEQPIDPRDIPF